MAVPWRAGLHNDLTDVCGIRVGHAGDEVLRSGTTAILFDEPVVGAYCLLGGAPGTRETDTLSTDNLLVAIDAFVLSGGSAFGLDAASGVQAYLREQGRGFAVGPARVPIVPGAILFDLLNGGAKDWGRFPPYRDFGYEAARTASAVRIALGSVGAGLGATTARHRGGLGSASTVLATGETIAALVAVNAVGSPLVGTSRHFWAAPHEIGEEFGGLGLPQPMPSDAGVPLTKMDARVGGNTTIALIATDAALDKAAARRMAIAAQDGFARAIWPAHTDFDGDLVFAAATGRVGRPQAPADLIGFSAAATATMARAIARAIYETAEFQASRP